MPRFALFVIVFAQSTAFAEPLAGVFAHRDEHMLIELLALPSGRYALALQMKDSLLSETGEYVYDKKSLVLVNDSGERATYSVKKTDTTLVLESKGTGALTLAEDKALSEQLLSRAAEVEEQAKKDDDAAKELIKVGKPEPMPDGFKMEDIGADPQPKDVIGGAKVFSELHLFVHTPESHVLSVLDLQHKRGETPMTYIYFFPNGRFVETKVPDILAKDTTKPKPSWGAYTVGNDALTTFISGKKMTAQLLDGRRTIRWNSLRLAIVGLGAKEGDAPAKPQKTSAEDELEKMLKEMREATAKKK